MKKLVLLLASSLLMIGCTSNNQPKQELHRLVAFNDAGELELREWTIELKDYSSLSYSENYSSSATVGLKNTTNKTKTIKFTDVYLIRESNGAKYKAAVNLCYGCKYDMESEIVQNYFFDATTPTSLYEDDYVLTFIFDNIQPTYHLHEYRGEFD